MRFYKERRSSVAKVRTEGCKNLVPFIRVVQNDNAEELATGSDAHDNVTVLALEVSDTSVGDSVLFFHGRREDIAQPRIKRRAQHISQRVDGRMRRVPGKDEKDLRA